MFVIELAVLCFCVLFGCCLVAVTNTIDCLERSVSEMICYVSCVTLNSTHSLTLTRMMCKDYNPSRH